MSQSLLTIEQPAQSLAVYLNCMLTSYAFLNFHREDISLSTVRLNARRSLSEIGEEDIELDLTSIKFLTQAISSFSTVAMVSAHRSILS